MYDNAGEKGGSELVIMRKLRNPELNRLTPEAYKQAEKLPLVVVLDNIRSCNNIGSVFRTSDALIIGKIGRASCRERV